MTFNKGDIGCKVEIDNVAEISIRRTEIDNLYLLRAFGVDGLALQEEVVSAEALQWLTESHMSAVRKCISNWSCHAAQEDLDEELIVCCSKGNSCEAFHRIRRNSPNVFGSHEYRAVRNDVLPDTAYNCVEMFGAPRVSSIVGGRGVLRIALYPRAAGFLAHEIIGHPIETKGSMRWMLRHSIEFPRFISVVDNPGISTRYGGVEYDCNGMEAQYVCCVTNGRLVDSLQGDGRHPRNLRRENANCEMETRMSNLIVTANESQDDVDADLYLYDCIEGDEPTRGKPMATIVGILPEIIVHGRSKRAVKIKCSFALHEFAENVIAAFGSQSWRPIDCFQKKSGWVRTSVESPGLLVEIKNSALELDLNEA